MFKTNKVVAAVRKIAANNPEAKYVSFADRTCYYTKGNAGSGCGCIVGQAILSVYPELKERLEIEDSKIDDDSLPAMSGAMALLHDIGFEGKLCERSWLDSVQRYQDIGDNWEKAVLKADQHTMEVYGEKV